MNELKYWEDKWLEVGKDYILNKNTTKENIDIWDNSSKTYDETVSNTRAEIIWKLKDNGYINEESVVLDLGCGTGLYSIELSKICRGVHAMDYSNGMLDIFRKKVDKNNIKNIQIINMDWNKLDTKKYNMEKKYDFVLSSLNPSCYNPYSLIKMSKLSKNYCCYIGTNGRSKNEILNKADKEILGKSIKSCDISNIIYPFNILYFSGYNPVAFYENCNWESRHTYEEGIEKLINRYKNLINIDKTIKDKIDNFVRNNMKNNEFVDISENKLGVILWKVI